MYSNYEPIIIALCGSIFITLSFIYFNLVSMNKKINQIKNEEEKCSNTIQFDSSELLEKLEDINLNLTQINHNLSNIAFTIDNCDSSSNKECSNKSQQPQQSE